MKSALLKILIPGIALASGPLAGAESTPPDHEKNQSAAVFLISSEVSSGTGFACRYKEKDFVATNLHVLDGAKSITIKNQSGSPITLSGKIIAAEDSDICLLGIIGSFSDNAIIPLTFAGNAFESSKVGDEVICLGNSLGNGVITKTTGAIKAYGTPQLEITCPIVKGNSGGPLIHKASGKVIGLVTEATINNFNFDELGAAASRSKDSQVRDISYFAHRIDTVKKWSATSLDEYLKTSHAIKTAETSIWNTALFIFDKPGWEGDQRLKDNWNEYRKFIDAAADKSSSSVRITESVNEEGVVLRRDVRVRSKSVSQQDYDKAHDKFRRGVEWNISTAKGTLEKIHPIGYRQSGYKTSALAFSTDLLMSLKDL